MSVSIFRNACAATRFAPIALALALFLAGCGTGAGTDDFKFGTDNHTATELNISTRTLPAGHVDAAFPAFQLAADGTVAALSWTLASGTLPPGMHLESNGRLAGTPNTPGLFPMTVHATDGVREDSQTLLLSVDAFGLIAVNGLLFNEAWTDVPVTLASAGATGPVDFSVVSDPTSGWLADNHGAVQATYRPGSAGGAHDDVVVRATDRNSGLTAEVTLSVRSNPSAGHIARFGSTDVWYLDFSQKHGVHAFTSDWHACCAMPGLRGRGSLGSQGNAADQLTEYLVRRAALEVLNTLFLRNRDGSQGIEGMGVSFPIDRPDGQFLAPNAGGALPGDSTHYSILSLYNPAERGGFLGAAHIDQPDNPFHFNNSAGSQVGELGVFLHTITDITMGAYRLEERDLYANPIHIDDMPILRALLHGEDTTAFGARAEDIQYAIWALSRSVAAVAAHEIGHSCGLHHNQTTRAGAVMNYSTMIHPQSEYHFLPEHIAHLRGALPGPGRSVAQQSKSSPQSKTLAAQRAFLSGSACLCGQ